MAEKCRCFPLRASFQSVVNVSLTDGHIPYSFRYGTRLRYAAIIFNTTIQPGNLGLTEGTPIRDDWEDYVNSKVRRVLMTLYHL